MEELDIVLSVYMETRQIVKKGSTLAIQEVVWQENVLDKLPEIWHSENDRLEIFTYASNGKYKCTKLKRVRDKSNPEQFVTSRYTWYEVPELDAKEIYKTFRRTWDRQLAENQENDRIALENSRKSFSETIKGDIIEYRNFLLKSCDWMFTTDSVVADDVKQMWAKYRQALRDVTSVNAEEEDRLKWSFPLSPTQYFAQNEEVTQNLKSDDPEVVKNTKEYLMSHGIDPDAPLPGYLENPHHYSLYRFIRGFSDDGTITVTGTKSLPF